MAEIKKPFQTNSNELVIVIYYSLQDNKSFLFSDQLVVIIYQTSCKIKLVAPYTCIYISRDTFDLHNFER